MVIAAAPAYLPPRRLAGRLRLAVRRRARTRRRSVRHPAAVPGLGDHHRRSMCSITVRRCWANWWYGLGPTALCDDEGTVRVIVNRPETSRFWRGCCGCCVRWRGDRGARPTEVWSRRNSSGCKQPKNSTRPSVRASTAASPKSTTRCRGGGGRRAGTPDLVCLAGAARTTIATVHSALVVVATRSGV